MDDAKSDEFLTWCFVFPISVFSSEDNSLTKPKVGESLKETIAGRGMFSLCIFDSPCSGGVVASEVFSLKLVSFMFSWFRASTNLLTSSVVDAVGLDVFTFLHHPASSQYHSLSKTVVMLPLSALVIIIRTGLKQMQPMQLHWAPRHCVWVDCSFFPDTTCAWEFSRNAI